MSYHGEKYTETKQINKIKKKTSLLLAKAKVNREQE